MYPQSHRTMKLRNGWVLAILGALLVFCTLLANGQRHEWTNPKEEGPKSSRGTLRYTSIEEEHVHWDPDRTDAKQPIPHVVKQATSNKDVRNSNTNTRRSNYRTQSRQQQLTEKANETTIQKKTSEAITKTNQDTRNNRPTESQRLVDSERKHPLRRVKVVVDQNLNLTSALPQPATKSHQKIGRVPKMSTSGDTQPSNTADRTHRKQPRRGGPAKLTEPISEELKKTPSNNRRMDFDFHKTEHRETLIDQENIADLNSNPAPTFPRPTRESRTSKREDISPDTNDIRKARGRNDRHGRTSNSQIPTDTAKTAESRGRKNKSFEPSTEQESADIKPSKRKQIVTNARSTDGEEKNTPISPRPTRETQTINRGRSHYSPEANEEADPIKSRSPSGERSKQNVRLSRLQSRYNGPSRKPEDETSTPVGRGRQYTRRDPSPHTDESTSRSRAETGGRRGPPESRRDAIRSRNSPSRDESRKESPVSRNEKAADATQESRRGFVRSRRPISNERPPPLKEVDVQEDAPKRRDPARSRGGRLPTTRTNKPNKSLNFEINDDDNYPQEFIEKLRHSSNQVQSPLSSSAEDVVDVEESTVVNTLPTSESPEVSSTESPRDPARTSAFNQRRTKPSSLLHNTNNVTPAPETTLPSVPRAATHSRLQSLLKSRARSNTPDSSTSRPDDISSRLPNLKSIPDFENAIIPEEVSSGTQLPETSQSSEPLLPKRPGFRPRQPYVPKPRTLDTNPVPSPRTSNGNLRPRQTHLALPRTSSESSQQSSPIISTRLRTVTSDGRRASNPLLLGSQRPTLSSKLRALNLPKPQIEQEQVEDQVVVEVEEETNTKPSFRPKIPSLGDSEETQERVSKFKPKAKDLAVPKYTSGFRRNLPGTTSFETRNEVRTTTQLAAGAGVVPKHRFSSRYLAKTVGRIATPAYVATVPSVISTGTASSTVDYAFQDTSDAVTMSPTEIISSPTNPSPPSTTDKENARAAKELVTPAVATKVVVPSPDGSNSVYTGSDSTYNDYRGSSSSTTEKPTFRVLTTSLEISTTTVPSSGAILSSTVVTPTSTTVFRWKPVQSNDAVPLTTTTRRPTTSVTTTKRPVTSTHRTTTQRATGLANLILRALGVGTTPKQKTTDSSTVTPPPTTVQTTTAVPVTTTKILETTTTITKTPKPTTTTTTTRKPTTSKKPTTTSKPTTTTTSTTTTSTTTTTTTTTTPKPTTTTTTTTTPKPTTTTTTTTPKPTTTTTTTTTPKPTTTTTTTTTPKPTTTTTTTTTTTPKPTTTTTTTKKPTTTTKKPTTTTIKTTTTKKQTTTTKKPTTTTKKPTSTTTATTTTTELTTFESTPKAQPLTTTEKGPELSDNYINDFLLLNTLLGGKVGPGVSPRSERKQNAQEALANQIIELALQRAANPQSRLRTSSTTEDYSAILQNLVSPRSLSSNNLPQNQLENSKSPTDDENEAHTTTVSSLVSMSTSSYEHNPPIPSLSDEELLGILLQSQTANMPPAKKPKTTTTRKQTTTAPPTGLRWLLQTVSSGGPNRGATQGRSPLTGISTPLLRDPATQNGGEDADGNPITADPGLLNAAINVTRAVSQFMGHVIQGAADSFQNYVRQRTEGFLGNYFQFGPNA